MDSICEEMPFFKKVYLVKEYGNNINCSVPPSVALEFCRYHFKASSSVFLLFVLRCCFYNSHPGDPRWAAGSKDSSAGEHDNSTCRHAVMGSPTCHCFGG